MATYDLRQQIFCMNWISGIANRRIDTRERLQRYAHHMLHTILAHRDIKSLVGEWQVAWGPAIYQSSFLGAADNTMYVARTDPNIYVISVAGANPVSLLVDPLEAISVAQTVPWPYSIAENSGRIPSGTKLGLDVLLHNSHMESNGDKLLTFLHRISQRPIELHVAGSSLGGALSACLALALLEQKNQWDPDGNATIKVMNVAGATPGDAAFASYYDSKLGACTERLWNQKDVVPHFWAPDTIPEIPEIYSPQIPSSELIQVIVDGLTFWSSLAPGEYRQICRQTPGFPGKIIAEQKFPDVDLGKVSEALARVVLKKLTGNKEAAQWLVHLVAIAFEIILKHHIDPDSGEIVVPDEGHIREIAVPHLQTIETHLQRHKGYLGSQEINIARSLEEILAWLRHDLADFLKFLGEMVYQHIGAYAKQAGVEEFVELHLKIIRLVRRICG